MILQCMAAELGDDAECLTVGEVLACKFVPAVQAPRSQGRAELKGGRGADHRSGGSR